MSSPHRQQEHGELRVLHWNIHSWLDADSAPNHHIVADLISETNPHVVSLVEVDEPWGHASALNDVANRLGYTTLFTPTFEFGSAEPAGGFGNALLTTLPVHAVQQWQLLWPPRIYDGTEPSEARSIVFAKLQFDSTHIWAGSTHLPRRNAQERTDALQRITTLVENLDAPWLVCGDFNTPVTSWIRDEYPFTFTPQPPQPTYPAHQPREPIDYCLTSPSLHTESKALPVSGSDHLPLLTYARVAG